MRGFLRAECLLVLYEEEGRLQVRAAHGVDPEAVWTTAPISLSLLEQVRATGVPMLNRDVTRESELQDIASLLLSDIRSVVCVPVFENEGQVRGLLYADSRGMAGAFTRADLSRLSQVARRLELRLAGREPEPLGEGEGVAHDPPEVSASAAPPTGSAPPEDPARIRAAQASDPTSTSPDAAAPRSSPAGGRARGAARVVLSSRSRVLFLRSLATLVRAAIPLTRSLLVLAEQAEDPVLRKLCDEVERDLQGGTELSLALGKRAGLTSYQLRLIRVGEQTGALVEILERLAQDEERRQGQVLKLRSSLTYPAFIFALCLAILLLAPPFLLEGQLRMLAQFNPHPPLLTRAVIALAGWLRNPVVLALGGLLVLAGVALARAAWGLPAARLALSRQALRAPVLGPALTSLALARFSASLALMLRAGVEVREAVRMSAESATQPALEERVRPVLELLQDGCSLTESLQGFGFFPRSFLSVLAAGEESGRLEFLLEWSARLQELELEHRLEQAAAALEPSMMMLMGILTGLMAFATLGPMVELLRSL